MACGKTEDFDQTTGMNNKIMVLGHAGMGIYYSEPEDSYESVRPTIDIGCDGSEIDIQMTKDSVLVIFHHGNLGELTHCDGRIYEHNWDEIKDCRYKSRNVKITSLRELLEGIPNLRDYYFSLDCKLDSKASEYSLYQDRFLRAIKRIGEQYGMSDHLFIEQYEPFLRRAQKLGLQNKLFLLTNNDDHPVDKVRASGFFGISVSSDISREDIAYAHSKGVYVMVWYPGNFSENKATLEKQPDIIQSDDPISLLKLLNRYNYENVTP